MGTSITTPMLAAMLVMSFLLYCIALALMRCAIILERERHTA
jgi:hypothetical protein